MDKEYFKGVLLSIVASACCIMRNYNLSEDTIRNMWKNAEMLLYATSHAARENLTDDEVLDIDKLTARLANQLDDTAMDIMYK